jgi:hypothetical protein
MADFVISGPDGKKYKVSGDSAEGAVAALKKMLGGASAESVLPPEVAARAQAAKAGTLDVPQESVERQKQIDRAGMPHLLGIGEGPISTMQRAAGQAATFGLADEAAAAVGSLIPGNDYSTTLQADRQREASMAEANPKSAVAGSLVGMAMNPAVRAMPGVSTVGGAAAQGAAIAGADAFGNSEGGIANRAVDAAKGAGVGALFGAATKIAIDGASSVVNKMLTKSTERPTIEMLKSTKNAAYNAVDQSGETFTGSELKGLYSKAQQIAKDGNFVKEADPQTFGAIKTIEAHAKAGKDISLSQLDKIRQALWSRYNRGDEPIILDMIGAVDDMVTARAGASAQMEAARLANSRYAKSQLLESAFWKARLQTSSSGSGGNILNKYRQAVTSIITNPKEARWFGPDEISIMEKFVMGSDAENVLRRIGKLSPGGNGLMTALNVYAAAVNPQLLAVTGVATGAKAMADKSAMKGSEAILDAVSTGAMPQAARQFSGAAGKVGGAAANALGAVSRGR